MAPPPPPVSCARADASERQRHRARKQYRFPDLHHGSLPSALRTCARSTALAGSVFLAASECERDNSTVQCQGDGRDERRRAAMTAFDHERPIAKAWACAQVASEVRPKLVQSALDSAPRCLSLTTWLSISDAPLDRTFAALADPTRRAYWRGSPSEPDLSVSALAEPFAVSLPAIMKHLDVLSDAGLVARTKSGRTVTCRLDAAPMQDAIAWLNRYERFWSEACPTCPIFGGRRVMAITTAVKPSLTVKRRLKAPAASLRGVDRPGKNKALDGTRRDRGGRVAADARVGGRYRIEMRRPSGEAHDVGGVYREIVPNEKLVFTWAWDAARAARSHRASGPNAGTAGQCRSRREYRPHPRWRGNRIRPAHPLPEDPPPG